MQPIAEMISYADTMQLDNTIQQINTSATVNYFKHRRIYIMYKNDKTS